MSKRKNLEKRLSADEYRLWSLRSRLFQARGIVEELPANPFWLDVMDRLTALTAYIGRQGKEQVKKRLEVGAKEV